MAHNQRIRPPGMWTQNSVLLPAEVELLDAAQFAEINGDAGGTWAPAAQIIVGGAGLWVTAYARLDNADVTIPKGRTLNLLGTETVEPGATIEVLGNGSPIHPGTISVADEGVILIGDQGHLRVLQKGSADVFGTANIWSQGILNIQKLGVLDILAGGVAKIESGGLLRVLGTAATPGVISVENGAEIDLHDGATLYVKGGAISLRPGGTAPFGFVAAAGTQLLFGGWSIVNNQASTTKNAGTIYVGSVFGAGKGHIQIGSEGDVTWESASAATWKSGSTSTLEKGAKVTDAATHTVTGQWVFNNGGLGFENGALNLASSIFGVDAASAAEFDCTVRFTADIGPTIDPGENYVYAKSFVKAWFTGNLVAGNPSSFQLDDGLNVKSVVPNGNNLDVTFPRNLVANGYVVIGWFVTAPGTLNVAPAVAVVRQANLCSLVFPQNLGGVSGIFNMSIVGGTIYVAFIGSM